MMDAPPTGTPIALAPLVTRVLAPNPSAYTFTGTQTHLVGTRDLAVIDPGPDDAGHVAALLAAIGARLVAAILVTHHHRDHSPASRALAAATGAPIVGAAPTSVSGGTSFDDAFDADYAPDRVLGDGESVRGSEWTLVAVATPGHTANHLAFALPEGAALFTGDHVMGWSTSVVIPPDGDMGAYVASLEKLQARDDRIYYPAHGEAVENPARLVRGMIGHRKAREGQLLRLLDRGVGEISAMVAEMYVGLDPRLLGGAEVSVLAHLLDLEKRGLAQREGDAWTR